MGLLDDCGSAGAPYQVVAGAAAGLLVGMWIDVMRHEARDIYRRSVTSRQVSLQPLVTRQRRGAMVRLAW